MNDSNQSSGGTKKITLGLVMGWILGIFFLLAGITDFTSQPVVGILFLISALFALPVATKFMSEKMHFSLSVGVRIVIVVILLAIAGSVSSSNQSHQSIQTVSVSTPDESQVSKPKTSTAVASVPVAPKPLAIPVVIPTPLPTPQVLLDVSGSGTKTTQTFTAAGDWTLNYSYDCSNFDSRGNFIVSIYNSDGSQSFDNDGPNELGAGGSDIEYYHKGGSYYLEVNSECNWKITAKG